jgi:hypothetical protein
VSNGNENERIPDDGTAQAASWLEARDVGLGAVAQNGDTCLFWFVAGLLACYLEEKRNEGR